MIDEISFRSFDEKIACISELTLDLPTILMDFFIFFWFSVIFRKLLFI